MKRRSPSGDASVFDLSEYFIAVPGDLLREAFPEFGGGRIIEYAAGLGDVCMRSELIARSPGHNGLAGLFSQDCLDGADALARRRLSVGAYVEYFSPDGVEMFQDGDESGDDIINIREAARVVFAAFE